MIRWLLGQSDFWIKRKSKLPLTRINTKTRYLRAIVTAEINQFGTRKKEKKLTCLRTPNLITRQSNTNTNTERLNFWYPKSENIPIRINKKKNDPKFRERYEKLQREEINRRKNWIDEKVNKRMGFDDSPETWLERTMEEVSNFNGVSAKGFAADVFIARTCNSQWIETWMAKI